MNFETEIIWRQVYNNRKFFWLLKPPVTGRIHRYLPQYAKSQQKRISISRKNEFREIKIIWRLSLIGHLTQKNIFDDWDHQYQLENVVVYHHERNKKSLWVKKSNFMQKIKILAGAPATPGHQLLIRSSNNPLPEKIFGKFL